MVSRYDLNPHDGECGLEEDATGEWVRQSDYQALEDAATALIRKMTAIERNGSFQSMFTLAHIHGQQYHGPNWKKEYEQLLLILPEDVKVGLRMGTNPKPEDWA